ncbi:MAG: FxLYD domain-containing protein [Nannocystaceae bacterium]
MSTSVIRCPGCGAADTSTAGAGGIHTCVYCGVRYQIHQGTPQTVVMGAPATAGGKAPLVAGAVALLVVAAVAGLYLFTSQRGPSRVEVSIPPVALPPLRADSSGLSAPSGLSDPSSPPVTNKTVSVAPPAEDLAPASATFTMETTRPGSSALWIYGIFRNTSPFTLGKTKVTAVFYDKDGKELAQDHGYTEDDVIPAGAEVPTTILANDPPAVYDRLEFEVVAERPSYLPTQVGGLEIEAEAPRKDGMFGWKYAGKVHNKGDQPARFVKIECFAYDSDGKFAGRAFSYADGEILQPGASARFNGIILDSEPFARFEFKVTGTLAN